MKNINIHIHESQQPSQPQSYQQEHYQPQQKTGITIIPIPLIFIGVIGFVILSAVTRPTVNNFTVPSPTNIINNVVK